MKGPVRLLSAVAALLCICPAIYPEGVTLPSADDLRSASRGQLYSLSFPGGRMRFETEVSADANTAGGRLSFYTVPADQLLLNLLRPVLSPLPDAGADAEGSSAQDLVAQTDVFFSGRIQNGSATSWSVPLDTLLSPPAGPSFFDNRHYSLTRFIVTPGTFIPGQATLAAIEAQSSAGEGSFLERLGDAGSSERVLLVLLSIALALIPVLLRRLGLLKGFLSTVLTRVGSNAAVLWPAAFVPSEIAPVQTETGRTAAEYLKISDKTFNKNCGPVKADAIRGNVSAVGEEAGDDKDGAAMSIAIAPARAEKKTRPEFAQEDAADAQRRQRRVVNGKGNGRQNRDGSADQDAPAVNQQAGRAIVPAVAADSRGSFRQMRAGVMLEWLEASSPGMLEAVAWEDEHLGEYRGLPFADPDSDERQNEPEQQDQADPGEADKSGSL